MGGIKKLMKLSAMNPVPTIDYDAEAKKRAEEERKKLQERSARGSEDNIKTSHTGVLGGSDPNLKRKNLLGE